MPEVQKQVASDSLENFISRNRAEADPGSGFCVASERILQVNVDGKVWQTFGSAIAYYGDIEFSRLPTAKAKHLSTAFLREVEPLVAAEGKGRLFCAFEGRHIRIVQLTGETLNVCSTGLLAFEDSLDFELFVPNFEVSATSGGIFGVKLSGKGYVAISVHGQPIVLPVTSERPLHTDPHATIAWTEGLEPTLSTDLTWRTFLLHGGGQSFQMHFKGNGDVAIQPGKNARQFKGEKIKKLIKKV
jgi:uncharacterized protein (AIM24 family)